MELLGSCVLVMPFKGTETAVVGNPGDRACNPSSGAGQMIQVWYPKTSVQRLSCFQDRACQVIARADVRFLSDFYSSVRLESRKYWLPKAAVRKTLPDTH
jgi:hypothetical protein